MDAYFIDTKKAAELLNISVRSVQDLCSTKDFPAVKFGKKYLINARLLEEWARRVAIEGGELKFF